MNPPDNAVAFGAPGIEPRWTSSAKEGVGTETELIRLLAADKKLVLK